MLTSLDIAVLEQNSANVLSILGWPGNVGEVVWVMTDRARVEEWSEEANRLFEANGKSRAIRHGTELHTQGHQGLMKTAGNRISAF